MQFVKHELGNFIKAVTVGFFYSATWLGVRQFFRWVHHKDVECYSSLFIGAVFSMTVVTFLYYWVLSLTDELERFERGEKKVLPERRSNS